MSRVCVKGLPRYASEASLRAYFSGVGDITDVKIARTKYVPCRALCAACHDAHCLHARHTPCVARLVVA
ncbi:hypothetical protein EON68_01325 [archaeon]|nr:MAG: hypothetical protein EON68_01325 [archaeon]